MPSQDPIEDFNSRLDALRRGDEPALDGLSEADRQALELARRLAALNPSQDSRLRYPLRHALLQRAHSRDAFACMRRVELSRLSLLPSLSLALAFVVILTWAFTGLSAAVGSSYQALPTSYYQPVVTGQQTAPPVVAAKQAFVLQPIPTPLAPHSPAATAVTAVSLDPSQTPMLNFQETPPTASLTGGDHRNNA
jgi:hypothetical protein